MSTWIESEKCNGCGRCFKTCPYGAVEIGNDDKAHILETCISCGACIESCPQKAIQTDVTKRTIPDFSNVHGVWIIAEQHYGELNPISLELLGIARHLASELNQEVVILLLGDDSITSMSKTLIQHGADRVLLLRHPELREYRTDVYTDTIETIVSSRQPNILLIGATLLGRDLAPRLARRLQTGLTADCTGLAIDPGEKILLQTRPAFGGNIMATIVCRYSRPQMATVRPGVMVARKIPENRGIVEEIPLTISPRTNTARIIETIRTAGRKIKLNDAKSIVAGGRGLGSAAAFSQLEKLAAVINGEIAGTRIAVENGWIPAERQVGQTGQTVRPELYIACGISGAVQHRAGMMNSRYIIAINKDANAPIFKIADWGIVGDVHQVVPELTARLQ